MKREDFQGTMPFGIIIDIDMNIRGIEHCSHNIQIFNNMDNKQDSTVIQDYKNNCKTMTESNNTIIKILALN